MRKQSLAQATTGILCAVFLFTGCGLFPEEEEFAAAPVLKSYEAPEYTMTPVIKGDVRRTENVKCEFMSVQEEAYGFLLGGETLEGIYVSKNQKVKAGTLLAELSMGNIKDSIEELNHTIDVLSTESRHISEDWELELTYLETRFPLETDRDYMYDNEVTKINETYSDLLREKEDAVYIARKQLAELEAQKRERQIYAAFDGVVTDVKEMDKDERTVSGQKLVTVADMDQVMFLVKGNTASYFPIGTKVEISVGKSIYTAESVEYSDSDTQTACLKPVQNDPSLKDGDQGTIQVILEERKNTLYVDTNAVKTMDGQNFVYVLDEQDMRIRKNVVTGITGDGVTEILEGLSEGDSVILE